MTRMIQRISSITAIDRLWIRFWLSQIVLLIALLGILIEEIHFSPLLIALTLFMSASLFFPPMAGIVPRKWMPVLSAFLAVGIITDLAIHWSQPLDAFLRAGYLVLWTRTIFYRTSRESLQLLLLALFLIMLTGVFSVSISYVIQLLLFAPISMILLMLNTTKDPSARDCLEHADWKQLSIPLLLKKIRNSLSWPLFGLVTLSTLFMVLSISAIFVILPRFHFNQMIPSLSLPGVAKSGFSENFQLGSVTSIIEDPSIAFRVEIPDPSTLPNTPYWRMLVLDVYQDSGFTQTTEFARRLSIPTLMTSSHFLSNRMIRNPHKFTGVDWVFYLEGSVSRYLPNLGSFRSIEFQTLQSIRIDPVQATFRLGRTSSQLTSYKLGHVDPLDSFRASPIENLLKEMEFQVIEPESNTDLSNLTYPQSTLTTRLSMADAEALQRLVENVKNQHVSEVSSTFNPVEHYVNQVAAYLKSRHSYSLQSKVASGGRNRGTDPVIAWMQSDSAGHCEYFAAASVLLLRANQIPARIVTGFVGGEWNAAKKVYTVRNFNAHAWCEYFDDSGNWQRLDSTPPGRWDLSLETLNEYGIRVFRGWLGWIESLKLNYYRTIVGFDDASQYEMVSKIAERMQQANFRFDGFTQKLSSWFKGQEADTSETTPAQPSKIVGIGISFFLIPGFLIIAFIGHRFMRNRGSDKTAPAVVIYEQKCRKTAGKLLNKLKTRSISNGDAIRQLQTIRFGPVYLWQEPKTIFKRTRLLVRKSPKKLTFAQGSDQ